jgi:hypothetical protein
MHANRRAAKYAAWHDDFKAVGNASPTNKSFRKHSTPISSSQASPPGHEYGSFSSVRLTLVICACVTMTLFLRQSNSVTYHPISFFATSFLAKAASYANESLPSTAFKVMLSYVRKHAVESALMVVVWCVPVVHGASIGTTICNLKTAQEDH